MLDVNKFDALYKYASKVRDPLGINQYKIQSVMDITKIDYEDNFPTIYRILKGIEDERQDKLENN